MTPSAREPTPGCWCRSGEAWIVGLGGRRTPVRDSKGLRHLAHLLARPGEEVGSLDLVALAEGRARRGAMTGAEDGLTVAAGSDAGPVLDEQAKAQYKARLTELQEEAEEADRFNDPERAARARAELDFLAQELRSAVGLGGRDRRVGADTERARVNVTRAIHTAIDRIAEHDEPLGEHLRSAVRTGTFCAYEPPAADPVAWAFDHPGPPADPTPAPPVARGAARLAARPAPELVERDAELQTLAAELEAAAAGSGRIVIVDGPPGIGKSAFLQAAERDAAQRGFAVLKAVGRELEQPFAFGVVRRLFDAPLAAMTAGERAVLLEGSVHPAAAMLGYAPAAGAEPGRAFPILNGLYWLTVALARERPLLVIADDLQWCDEESLAWLAFMISRLDDLRVTILIGTRPITGTTDPARAELLGGRQATVLHLAPLSDAAVATVARRTLPEADDAFVAACAASSRGNPFFLLELLASARAAGLRPDADGARRLRAMTPEAVRLLVLSRLASLSADARSLAAACAILAPVDDRPAADVAAIEAEDALAAADELVGAGILAEERPLDFVHPLVRSAIEGSLSLSERTHLHERAAQLLRERGAPALEVAAHLRHARPAGDGAVAAILREAAGTAAAHGSTGAATELLERALREPPPPAQTPHVLLDLARARAEAGDEPRAVEAAQRGLELAEDDVRLRALLVDELCRHERFDVDRRIALLDAEIERVAPIDPELRFTLEARALQLLYYATIGQGSAELSRRHGERLDRIAAQALGTSAAERLLLSMLASQQGLNYAVPAERVAAMAERALDDGVLIERLAAGDDACDTALEALLAADRFDAADRHARAAERLARSRGAVLAAGYACMLRGFVALRRGALLEVEALLPSILEVGGLIGGAYVPYVAHGFEGIVGIHRGDFDAAWDAARKLAASDFAPHAAPAVRGMALAAQGEHDLAVGELRTALRLQRAAGRRMSLAYGALGPELAVSLAATGEREEAEALARDELAAARGFGAPTAVGGALRALGLVVGGPERLTLLEEAVAVLADSQALLHRARALHALGGARLAAGHTGPARVALAEAVSLAERCAATQLAEAAGAELEMAGGAVEHQAPTARELLTPGERRVAELAAEGATQLEIAQALLSTVPAVAGKLESIRRKLGVEDARELAGVLSG